MEGGLEPTAALSAFSEKVQDEASASDFKTC
jgi:hypothetical protein